MLTFHHKFMFIRRSSPYFLKNPGDNCAFVKTDAFYYFGVFFGKICHCRKAGTEENSLLWCFIGILNHLNHLGVFACELLHRRANNVWCPHWPFGLICVSRRVFFLFVSRFQLYFSFKIPRGMKHSNGTLRHAVKIVHHSNLSLHVNKGQ